VAAKSFWVQALVQGVLSEVVALLAFTAAMRWLGASKAAVFPALVPVTATLIGIPVSGGWPNVLQITTLGLVSAGLLLAMGLVRRRG